MDEIKELIHSPSIGKQIFEHKMKIENETYENTWRSFCIETDKRAVVYFSQLFIITGIMVFSIYQLMNTDRCENQAYMGLLTLLIGLIMPGPQIAKDKK